MNWGSHSVKIVNNLCLTLGVMNCYLPLSALKIMYDSLILSHIQFGITCWGFERGRLAKLQKRAVRIITNSKYNAHTEPLFKDLHLLKITDIFDVQCMKFWYKFSNNTLSNYFRSMFQYNSSLLPRDGAFDLGLAVSVPLPIVTGIFVLLWFQSRLT